MTDSEQSNTSQEDILTALLIKRDNIKCQLTRFSVFLEQVTPDKLVELDVRLQKAQQLHDQFDEIQSIIEGQLPDEHRRQERESFENTYFSQIAKAHQILRSQVSPQREQTSTQQIRNQGNHSAHSTANLPAINLPKFNGVYDEWLQFFEIFNSIVHQNDQLSNIQKYYYLQSSLQGVATQVLQSLEISDANYPIAIQLLKDRFENKRLLVHNHIKNLLEINTTQRDSHIAIRKLIDNTTKNLRALKSLNQPVEHWDTILIYLISQKLDIHTRKEWETSNKESDPKLSDLLDFLKTKCEILETLNYKTLPSAPYKHYDSRVRTPGPNNQMAHVSTNATKQCCHFCKQTSHLIFKCYLLQSLSLKERTKQLRERKICTNCLRIGHTENTCQGRGCKVCNMRHNTLLHDFSRVTQQSHNHSSAENQTQANLDNGDSDVALTSQTKLPSDMNILLPTATVYINAHDNKMVKCTALLDSGSQTNFCTKNLFERLGIPGSKIDISITGISQVACNITNHFTSQIQSKDKTYKQTLQFLVVDKITSHLPQTYIDVSRLNIPSDIELADSNFNAPHKIDLLLGAEIFFQLLNDEQITLGRGKTILRSTKLGWILAGPILNEGTKNKKRVNCLATTANLAETLQRFWTVEGFENNQKQLSNEEMECEIDFRRNMQQDGTGRYTVALPLKSNYVELGDSLIAATNRLHSIEKRLSKDQELSQSYNQFLSEYLHSGHMAKIETKDNGKVVYYLPHHPVLKETSTTTKVRVVFDGSCKSSTGLSLNDVLKVGPKVQSDLLDIVLRMRTHPYVIIADVEKMFRQVNIQENQTDLQRILWRSHPDGEIEHYRLLTITYGTASASFLACRVLHQIGLEAKTEHDTAARSIIEDFYMDDLITGASTIQDAVQLKTEISEILAKSGFKLRKWLANDPEILEHEHNSAEESQYLISTETKTLGIKWDPTEDVFQHTCPPNIGKPAVTKRAILSAVAQFFDPLGLIGPVVVLAKQIIQALWKANLDWDEPINENLKIRWENFVAKVKFLDSIKIPRGVIESGATQIELHGFSDASESAFGACIYVRYQIQDKWKCNLLCSKSRLAPIKSLTLPRLELCGALLLAQLIHRLKGTLRVQINRVICWTDSQIVLAWLNAEPCKWKTFIANRVAEIQELTPATYWRHISSQENPADLVSRGREPQELQSDLIWWTGPSFLSETEHTWPQTQMAHIPDIPEARKEKIAVSFKSTIESNDILTRYSSFTKLTRIMSYVFRFIENVKSKDTKLRGPLSGDELESTTLKLCKLVQEECFSREVALLKNNKPLPKQSRLHFLHAFIDDNDLIRVGGRLENADLTYDQKHPIVLPEKHHYTVSLVRYFHHKFLHAGPQLLLAQIRLKYWPINGRNLIRKILRHCITCFRVKPRSPSQLLGSLPKCRVAPSKPFNHCGVDYAGPYPLKDGKTRSRSVIKAYLCIFICMSTRAVHIELVTGLSSQDFLNAFKRFTARRGLCRHMYSDNGTNFVGANNELRNLSRLIKGTIKGEQFNSYFTENRITWHFIPARSPHLGGIWESAVRSFKYHLKRVVHHDTCLDFESFYTVLTQIEAILNSRPILPLSNDPLDLQVLTPGHFLIGDSLTSVPQDLVLEVPRNRLSHYKRLQQMVQQFWTSWKRSYLHTLQQRYKWPLQMPNIAKDAMVLIKEDNLPPMCWSLGRVIATHPGSDGFIRVVSLKTKSGVIKRSVHKVCPLPTHEE